jgi:hypothetical protein
MYYFRHSWFVFGVNRFDSPLDYFIHDPMKLSLDGWMLIFILGSGTCSMYFLFLSRQAIDDARGTRICESGIMVLKWVNITAGHQILDCTCG